MGRLVGIIWLILVVGVLALTGQVFGLYDVPVLRDIRGALPFGQAVALVAALDPTATAVPQVARTVAVASPSPGSTGDICSRAAPAFVHGAAALKARVGADMGDPLECERVVDGLGNTEQKTTTGLVYYRAQTNTAAFTNGWDHWAITATGAVHWTGDQLDPPPDAQPL